MSVSTIGVGLSSSFSSKYEAALAYARHRGVEGSKTAAEAEAKKDVSLGITGRPLASW